MKTVTAAILTKDNKVLIAKRRSTDKLANKWEFPGGRVEIGETPEQCLMREMKEELDIEVAVGECLAENVHNYEHGTIRLLAYRTCLLNGELHNKVHEEYKWVSLDQLELFDFAPADILFVDKLRSGQIEL